MYSLVNNLENKVIANLNSDAELIHKVRNIAVENEDNDLSILSLSEAKEYIEVYCDNLDLLIDSEVEEFLNNHGTEVLENEPSHYVELMMDDHKCTKFKGKQYYISNDWDLTENEEKIYDILAYALHV
jgi:hypothetical protein